MLYCNGPYDYELNCFQPNLNLPTIFKVVFVVLSREPPAKRHCGSGSWCSFSSPNSTLMFTTVQEYYKVSTVIRYRTGNVYKPT